jgi:hypothetical protein
LTVFVSVVWLVPPGVLTVVWDFSLVSSVQPARAMLIPVIKTPASAALIKFLMSDTSYQKTAASGLA